jgi:aldehyde:ferredoxin oxidoreductase
MANMMFTFPYKNRVEGQSPDAETLDGKGILASFEERGGGMHNCLTGCIVQCSNLVHDADGNYKTSALEFETLTLLGSNCAVQTWDEVAELDRLCDELGLDTIETGAALGILMDSGGMDWGDSKAMLELMKSMASGDKKGLMIGDGADETGRQTGHHRIPTVRGQSIPAWDPRPLKATGVSYATSAMGADHTAGLVVNPGMAEADMPKASQESQIINAVVDSSGFCMFLMLNLDQIRGFLGDFVGEDISREEIIALGWECLQDEWKFNDAAGHDKANDDLPQCMKEDKIGPQEVVFDVSQETIQQVRAKLLAEPTDAFCGSGSIA